MAFEHSLGPIFSHSLLAHHAKTIFGIASQRS
jgi:hypothetical protein